MEDEDAISELEDIIIPSQQILHEHDADVPIAWDKETVRKEPLPVLDPASYVTPEVSPSASPFTDVQTSDRLIPSFIHTPSVEPVFEALTLSPSSDIVSSGDSPPLVTRLSPSESIGQGMDNSQIDARGILRGSCNLCDRCKNFKRHPDASKFVCANCCHPPAKHKNLTTTSTLGSISILPSLPLPNVETSLFDITEERISTSIENFIPYKCAAQRCNDVAIFDENSGHSSLYCEKHNKSKMIATPDTQLKCSNPNCGKQKWIEKGGIIFDFCGKTCRDSVMKQRSDSDIDIDPKLKCSNPSCSRKKWIETDGTMFDFCGKSCRDEFRKQPKPTGTLCLIPQCGQPCYVDPKTGTSETFCGQVHSKQAYKQILVELTPTRDEYQKILTHFNKEWVKRPPAPPVQAIFKVFNEKNETSFNAYRQSISFSQQEQHYHGTLLLCDLKAKKILCTNVKCGICGISRKGFDPSLKGTNIRFKRFGDGFYLAPNSSKCHDYTQGHIDYRAMLLCDVAPGKKHIVTNDETTLKSPPNGHDSVYGKKGGALNYDEIVLYKSEAINPKYIIFYTKDGINKIAK